MRCLITGCAGFIGSHLTEALLAQGHEVVGVDAFAPTYDRWVKERNLERARADRRFRLVEADLAEAPLAELVNGMDVVFHLAGEPGVRQSWGERFATYVRNNVLATERLLNACVDLPLQRFVYAGSSSVYGDAPDLPWRETTCPQPRSPYAISKLAAEHLCTTYHLSFGVPATVLRYFTVYGPRQRPDMAFHRWLRAGLTGDPISVFGSGEKSRDFTFVADIVAATIAAGTAGSAVGGTFNVGGSNRVTIDQLLVIIESLIGRPLIIERRAHQEGDVQHTWADTSQAAAVLGYHPTVGLTEGLERELAWMRTLLAAS
jgi:nucleoside-diphosphate-sugar epimerase